MPPLVRAETFSRLAAALEFSTRGDGLYQAGERTYTPSQGKFLQPDPEGILSSTNLYTYAGNNPVVNIDPSGTDYATYGGVIHAIGGGGFEVKVTDTGRVFVEIKLGGGLGGGSTGSSQRGTPSTGFSANGTAAAGGGIGISKPLSLTGTTDQINKSLLQNDIGPLLNDVSANPVVGALTLNADIGYTFDVTGYIPKGHLPPADRAWRPDPGLFGPRGKAGVNNANQKDSKQQADADARQAASDARIAAAKDAAGVSAEARRVAAATAASDLAYVSKHISINPQTGQISGDAYYVQKYEDDQRDIQSAGK